METEPAMQGFKNCNTWGYSKIKACNKMLQAFLIEISDKLFSILLPAQVMRGVS